jgi:putative ABC transport system permease protein
MMTARAARRAVEVGVRKAVGATRRQIIVQFLGECLFYAGLALVIAVIAVKLTLPAFNGFLLREIAFDLMSDPLLDAALAAIWLVTGLAAGVYPALVLSMFRPSVVLKGVAALPGGSGRVRQALVVFQFGTLIALIVATLTIHRQTQYAIEERLRLPGDQIFVARSPCRPAFRDAVVQISGVRAASCSSGSALSLDRLGTALETPKGAKVSFRLAPVDPSFFALLEVRPLAGRLFSPDRGEDNVLRADTNVEANPSIVINESGARALGFAQPQAAVNQYRRWQRIAPNGTNFRLDANRSSQIIGVIPDLAVGSVRDAIEPTAYYLDPSMVYTLILKLDGTSIPATMDAVRKLWAKQGQPSPFEGVFRSQYVNDLYADILRQSALFATFSGVAVAIAALGLLSLAVFTAERRTREIGLRKVMGASRWDILRFISWQFTRPVLWANLFAWPVAWLAMRRWLEGFAYHIDLNPLLFVAASALALVIALVTVAAHAVLVARTRPAAALRYE